MSHGQPSLFIVRRGAVIITGVADDVFDLSKTYVHLGMGSTALPLPGFSWSRQNVMEYLRKFAAERDERRLMGIVPIAETWTHWECHTGGDEVVVLLSGRCDVIQEVGGQYRTIPLRPGQAMINPRGVWHTSDVHEPGETLFVAAGRLTRYRPREPVG
jgi:uncharacterized cupin superfamily protein